MNMEKSKLQLAQKKAESVLKDTNYKIDELGKHTSQLYDELNSMQKIFDDIRNAPNENRLKDEELKKVRLKWKQQVEKIELDYKKAFAKNTGKAVAGVGTGVAAAAIAPTAAMGLATTFGVASTGTAISALSGAAATNAALAWLGGGALAAGGGGIAAGNAILALAGPLGWALAGVAFLGSGLLLWIEKNDYKRMEDIFTLISKRDIKSYKLAIIEINERIGRIKQESKKLKLSNERIRTFGLDYNLMTEAQQYELGSYVNLKEASTQLLINPIMGLLPKFVEDDYERFSTESLKESINALSCKDVIIFLCNLLYKIKLDEKDKKLLVKSLNNNNEFLSAMKVSKAGIDILVLDTVSGFLEYKYDTEKTK